ncbi:MAG: hypothetical protein TEF_12105 [Rhizobiales bacterium NRL2]|jgi:thiamine biosynthesis lipoprotein|nr:MAG: hypothetical protein TEF_12105 [Rhizobiales bacterium NRL2]
MNGHSSAHSPLSRRRFIGIAGAAAGLSLLPGGVPAARTRTFHWRGVALGADASIQIIHSDAREARRIIDLAVAEIERLEAIFSLYRPDSTLRRLNRDGRLSEPPMELRDILARAAVVSEVSGGVFDVTVQPLWERLARHFAEQPDSDTLPDLDRTLTLVDWRGVRIDDHEIVFDRSGMAVTLNGIAQGYITDRVAELLHRNGVDRIALDLGETRAIGRSADGDPWRVGIPDPMRPSRLIGRLDASDRAIATSGGYGLLFDRGGRISHLMNPRNGETAPAGRSVTVVAGEACLADTWSTAFALMETREVGEKARGAGLEVYLAEAEGTLYRVA